MESSSTSTPRTYDVFLSFRGEDTRRNFTDHLYATLVAYGFHTFRDDEELQKGGDISSDLSKAIEESRVFVIIFSKNYAHSRWCLNELVNIIQCTTQPQKESRVVPVFYHVNPSDVRNQLGSFGDAFAYHERDADEEKKEMIQKWRLALGKAASISGWHVDNRTYEAEAIEEIREIVIKILNRKPLYVGDNIVQMDFHLEQLKSLIKIELDEVRMIGIYGIGGIGKTTAAMAVYNDISSQFDGSSFLRDVGEKSKGGLLQLQQKLLRDILKGKRPKLSDTSEGISVIKERLCSKRVLIILDDVDELKQLENLAGKHGWYGAKSRIIVTTKNKQLLDVHGVNASYEVRGLNHEAATELFNWCAFKQNISNPKRDFESLSNSIVNYASGLPIALKVLGHFLFGRTIFEWKSALHRLEKVPQNEVQRVLRVSYDKLEDLEKEIFLDIACFFRGRTKDFVLRILGDDAEIGMKVLHDRCLISISENTLEMHDLLQRMGWEVVRQQCPKEPGGRSRLWDFNDVESVLTRNTGTKAIEGLFVEISVQKQIDFTTKAFKKMNKLRLLKVHQDAKYNSVINSWGDMNPSKVRLLEVHLPKDFEFPSYELRYLHWDGYSLESLPSKFHAKNLVELSLRCSNIKRLWKEKKLDKLKVIDLSYSLNLIEIPDFSSVLNLEILILEGCISLERLPSSFYKLECLQIISCHGCVKLKSFPEIKGNMRKLRVLNVSETAIVNVPSSIGLLYALEDLDLSGCKNLASIPESICKLSSLRNLFISECPKLNNLRLDLGGLQCLGELQLSYISCEWEHLSALCSLQFLYLESCNLKEGVNQSDNCLSLLKSLIVLDCNLMEGEILNHICQLSSLEILSLDWNHFSRIPAAIRQLSNLRALSLCHCKKLLQIPELPLSVRLLDAHNPPGTLSSPSLLPLNSLLNCFNSELQESRSQSNWNFIDLSSYWGPGTCIVIPGSSGIPGWIWHKRKGSEIETELPQNWYGNKDSLGFVVSCVYGPPSDEFKNGFENEPSCRLLCHLKIYGNSESADIDFLGFESYCQCFKGDNNGGVSDQVFVIFYPKIGFKERHPSDQWTHIAATFEGCYNFKVKECGVYLIDSSCLDSQQNMERRPKLCLEGNASSELSIMECP